MRKSAIAVLLVLSVFAAYGYNLFTQEKLIYSAVCQSMLDQNEPVIFADKTTSAQTFLQRLNLNQYLTEHFRQFDKTTGLTYSWQNLISVKLPPCGPDNAGMPMSLSRPGFNLTGTKALIELNLNTSGLYLLLEKKNNEWQITQNTLSWIE